MWNHADLPRAIVAARAQLGDGPFVVVTQSRSLDIDGYADSLSLSTHASLDDARRAFARDFDLPEWPVDPNVSLPVTIVAVDGVRVLDKRTEKRKENGFNAETRAVHLLEVDPPAIAEPLFRALGHADELASFLLRYR